MAALALSVLRGIVENDLKMEKVYVYLPQVNCAFSNIFASILRRSPISHQRLFKRIRLSLQLNFSAKIFAKMPVPRQAIIGKVLICQQSH